MKTRMIMTLGASALVLGAVGIASAGNHDNPKAAAASAEKASKALARHEAPAAIAAAEAAVATAEHDAGYRLLLGQSYLSAGRFVSARGAFADALTLAPTNGKAALNLALMQIATGDWAGARRTLDEHSAVIAPADRGLATALAGDPAGAVTMLTGIARSPEATPKVRQNLALSLALAGQWQAARAVAAVDLSPAAVDARMEQWASFARPSEASDQVASLLGVKPVVDGGQPVRIALNNSPAVEMVATSAPAPVVAVAAAPVAPASAPAQQPAPAIASAPVQPAVTVAAAPAPGFTKVSFAAPREVVQPLPAQPAFITPRAAYIAPGRGPMKIALIDPKAARASVATPAPRPAPMAAAPSAKGNFFVQLGAFESAAVARDAWGRATHRLPALAGSKASGMSFATKGASYYRLSVGGFARGDADALCRRYRQAGGACFVRAGAGDKIASWGGKGVQVASR